MSPLDQARAALAQRDDFDAGRSLAALTWPGWDHLRAALAEVDRLTAERDEAVNVIAASERWITLRDEVRRLDALARPGVVMDDDDLLDVVVRVLRRAAGGEA